MTTLVDEVAAFADTSLGTHVAMAVPLDITAGDFKRELEKTHKSCFPSFGEIKVYGLMVKRKSCLYYLPEAIHVKHVFHGDRAAWFICAEARVVKGSMLAKELFNAGSKKNNKKRINSKKLCSCIYDETPVVDKKEIFSSIVPGYETKESSQVVQAASISNFNFSSINEAGKRGATCASFIASTSEVQLQYLKTDDTCPKTELGGLQNFAVATPPRTFPLAYNSKPSEFRNTPGERERVGKRLLIASNNIQMYRKKQGPSTSSIFRNKLWRILGRNAANSLAKYLVFEISDSED